MNKVIVLLLFVSCSFIYGQDGLVTTNHPSGKIKSEINYVNNVKDGPAKFYNENGVLIEEYNYLNGRVDGLVKKFYDNGNPKEIYTIANGRREGPASYYKEDGTLLAEIVFQEGIILKDAEEFNPDELGSETDTITIADDVNLPPDIKEEKADTSLYLTDVEVAPEPVNGMQSIYNRLTYPKRAKDNNVQGTVRILAYINERGDVTKAEITNDIGHGCGDAAQLTIFYTKFKPGLLRGIPVKTKIEIPVEFKLTGTK